MNILKISFKFSLDFIGISKPAHERFVSSANKLALVAILPIRNWRENHLN
jgi:hypothetical protein